MIEAEAGVARPAIPHVIPEGVDALIRVELPDGVDPALAEQPLEHGAGFRLHEGVLLVGGCRVDVRVGRDDVVIAGEHDGSIERIELGGVADQPLRPSELVVEFRARLRIAVRSVEACDEDAVDSGFEIARLDIGWVAREFRPRKDGLGAASENGDAVPRFLPPPNRAIAGGLDGASRKIRIGRFQLLQTDDVRRFLAQPMQQIGEPLIDVVDVVGRDLHGGGALPLFP
jgi:hypothetical protein